MKTRRNKEYYEWADFWKDSRVLASKIAKSRKKFTHIYGIPRGGLIPAVCLSHLLGIPLLTNMNKVHTKTLIVDDIVDTGKTLQLFRRRMPFKRLSVAALYFQTGAVVTPQFFIRKKKNWVIFPWETEASSKYDFTLDK